MVSIHTAESKSNPPSSHWDSLSLCCISLDTNQVVCKDFLQVYGLSFHYSIFHKLNFKILIKSNLTVCSFTDHAFCTASKNSSPNPRLHKFSCFYLELLGIHNLHYTLIYWFAGATVYVCLYKKCDKVPFSFLWMCSCYNTIYWKDYIFSTEIPLNIRQKWSFYDFLYKQTYTNRSEYSVSYESLIILDKNRRIYVTLGLAMNL